MNSEAPYHLIAAWVNKTINEADTKALEDWKNASPNHLKIFNQTVKILNEASTNNYPDTDLAWKKLENKLSLNKKKKFNLIRIAAALTLFAGISLLSRFILFSEITVNTTATEIKQLLLPDGSNVWLKQNSTIKYPRLFSFNRNIKLTGTAYFEVMKDPNHPFSVANKQSVVTVLGTGFSVSESQENSQPQTTVSVKHGKVNVSALGSNQNVLLTNGQSATVFNNGTLKQQPITQLNEFAWQEQKLIFNNTVLSQIFKDIESYYQVKITVEDQSILNCHFTGEFTNPKLNDVLLVISKTLNLSYSINANTISIGGKGC